MAPLRDRGIKRRVESDFGACPIFVYPGGQRTVPPEPGTEAAREAGYAFAFAGPPDSVGPEKDAMALGRVAVLGNEDFDMFRLCAEAMRIDRGRGRRRPSTAHASPARPAEIACIGEPCEMKSVGSCVMASAGT